MAKFLHFIELLLACTGVSHGYTFNDVRILKTDLLQDYDATIRPVLDQDNKVVVDVSMFLINIQGIDEVTSKFSTTLFSVLTWKDEHLSWDPNNRSSITSVMFTVEEIWTPPISLVNPYSAIEQLGNDDGRLLVFPDGTVSYTTGEVFHSSCSVDITFYPFDKQTCTLYLSAFEFGPSEIALTSTDDKVATDSYAGSAEWTLVDTSISPPDNGDSRSITFSFVLERKSRFIINNVVLPIVFMSFINILVFVLPSDSGERVGFAVTVLLAIAVFLTMIGDSLPNVSDPLPILSNLLQAILSISVVECVITILSLFVYHKDETSAPPRWMQLFVNTVLCKSCSRSKSTVSDIRLVREKQDTMPLPQDMKVNKKDDYVPNVTWKDLSRFCDGVCLILFILITICVNAYYIDMMQKG